MKLFSSLFRKNSYLGIDIGTTTIKAAELVHAGKGLVTLTNYGILETEGYADRPNSALQTSNLKLVDTDTAQFLRLLISRMKPTANHVIATLPAFSSFTTLLELPLMSNHEIDQTIKFQSKNYVPLPIATVTIDWVKVGEKIAPDGTKHQQVFLISVPNELIETYTKIFKSAGLQLEALEIEGLSLARILGASKDKPILIIDIGGRSTGLYVAQNGGLKFAGQTDFASGSLTQALATALNINSSRAEDLKKQSQILGTGGGRELSTIMLPIIDVIINEAKRVRDGFEKGYGEKVASIILAGAGANLPGLIDYIKSQMGLEALLANPLSVINYAPEIEPLKHTIGPTLSAAIGAALKNFSLKNWSNYPNWPNFLNKSQLPKS